MNILLKLCLSLFSFTLLAQEQKILTKIEVNNSTAESPSTLLLNCPLTIKTHFKNLRNCSHYENFNDSHTSPLFNQNVLQLNAHINLFFSGENEKEVYQVFLKSVNHQEIIYLECPKNENDLLNCENLGNLPGVSKKLKDTLNKFMVEEIQEDIQSNEEAHQLYTKLLDNNVAKIIPGFVITSMLLAADKGRIHLLQRMYQDISVLKEVSLEHLSDLLEKESNLKAAQARQNSVILELSRLKKVLTPTANQATISQVISDVNNLIKTKSEVLTNLSHNSFDTNNDSDNKASNSRINAIQKKLNHLLNNPPSAQQFSAELQHLYALFDEQIKSEKEFEKKTIKKELLIIKHAIDNRLHWIKTNLTKLTQPYHINAQVFKNTSLSPKKLSEKLDRISQRISSIQSIKGTVAKLLIYTTLAGGASALIGDGILSESENDLNNSIKSKEQLDLVSKEEKPRLDSEAYEVVIKSLSQALNRIKKSDTPNSQGKYPISVLRK